MNTRSVLGSVSYPRSEERNSLGWILAAPSLACLASAPRGQEVRGDLCPRSPLPGPQQQQAGPQSPLPWGGRREPWVSQSSLAPAWTSNCVRGWCHLLPDFCYVALTGTCFRIQESKTESSITSGPFGAFTVAQAPYKTQSASQVRYSLPETTLTEAFGFLF